MGNVRYGKSLVGEKSGRGKVGMGKVGMGNGLWEKSVGEKSVWESSPNPFKSMDEHEPVCSAPL